MYKDSHVIHLGPTYHCAAARAQSQQHRKLLPRFSHMVAELAEVTHSLTEVFGRAGQVRVVVSIQHLTALLELVLRPLGSPGLQKSKLEPLLGGHALDDSVEVQQRSG